ncbi:MAG TPA: YtxH domain-containing protein [Clostridia bacterium]|nr:YtxH domain-containing protein [Clostridia bacterium]
MRSGFVKGVVVGSLVAASVSMMMNSDMMSSRTKRRMMRGGRSFIRKSGNLISDVAEMFR